jgi:hypothetical protein
MKRLRLYVATTGGGDLSHIIECFVNETTLAQAKLAAAGVGKAVYDVSWGAQVGGELTGELWVDWSKVIMVAVFPN